MNTESNTCFDRASRGLMVMAGVIELLCVVPPRIHVEVALAALFLSQAFTNGGKVGGARPKPGPVHLKNGHSNIYTGNVFQNRFFFFVFFFYRFFFFFLFP